MVDINFAPNDNKLDTVAGVRNPFGELSDISLVRSSGLHFYDNGESGLLSGTLRLVKSVEDQPFKGPSLDGDRLIISTWSSGGTESSRDVYVIEELTSYLQSGNNGYFTVGFGDIDLRSFLDSPFLFRPATLGGNDQITGSSLGDRIFSYAGIDVVAGGYGDDTIDSGAGNDELSGNQGHDAIKSGNGHDFVLGGDGRDTLTGGAGHDTLSGGVGRDTFHWERLSERGDVITDFRPKDDTLTFSSKGFAGMTEDYGFVSSKEPVATGDVGSFLFNKTTGDLSWDQDGAGSAKAVLIVTLQNLHAIGANDLVVI